MFKRGLLFTCPDEYTNYVDDDDDEGCSAELEDRAGGSSGSSMRVPSPQTGGRGMYTEETPLLVNTHDPDVIAATHDSGDVVALLPSTKRRSLDTKPKQFRSSYARSSSH